MAATAENTAEPAAFVLPAGGRALLRSGSGTAVSVRNRVWLLPARLKKLLEARVLLRWYKGRGIKAGKHDTGGISLYIFRKFRREGENHVLGGFVMCRLRRGNQRIFVKEVVRQVHRSAGAVGELLLPGLLRVRFRGGRGRLFAHARRFLRGQSGVRRAGCGFSVGGCRERGVKKCVEKVFLVLLRLRADRRLGKGLRSSF